MVDNYKKTVSSGQSKGATQINMVRMVNIDLDKQVILQWQNSKGEVVRWEDKEEK